MKIKICTVYTYNWTGGTAEPFMDDLSIYESVPDKPRNSATLEKESSGVELKEQGIHTRLIGHVTVALKKACAFNKINFVPGMVMHLPEMLYGKKGDTFRIEYHWHLLDGHIPQAVALAIKMDVAAIGDISDEVWGMVAKLSSEGRSEKPARRSRYRPARRRNSPSGAH